MKLLPLYSPKNLLSHTLMWYTSLPEQHPYILCHCSGDCCPSLRLARGRDIIRHKTASETLNSDTLLFISVICKTHYLPPAPPGRAGSPGFSGASLIHLSVSRLGSNMPFVMTSGNYSNCSSTFTEFNGLREMLRPTPR